MRSQIRLVRLFGVELGLHYSWMVIAVLIAFSLAAHFRQMHPGWSVATVWGSAILTALLFFVFIFAHELSHALVAKARGVPIRRIVLFALGGVAQIEKEPTRASTEFLMGVVGPATSLVIGLALLGIARALGWDPRTIPETPAVSVVVWLGRINIALAAFNMIPGFPLDGGRVLRAIIWAITKSAERSTRIAARIGQFVGIAFIVLGIWQFFMGTGINGLWLAFIGWFLLNAAGATYLRVQAGSALREIRVGQVMSHECGKVNGSISLQDFVDHYLLLTGRRCFVVTDNGRTLGLITPAELRQVEREHWPQTSVRAAMRPLDRIHAVNPDTPLTTAMEIMAREDINQLPVVSNGHVEGIVSRGQVLHLLQARSELAA